MAKRFGRAERTLTKTNVKYSRGVDGLWSFRLRSCDIVLRDICPQDYVFNHIPRTTGTGGGVGLLFKKNLKIKKLQTRTFRSFELMEVLL